MGFGVGYAHCRNCGTVSLAHDDGGSAEDN